MTSYRYRARHRADNNLQIAAPRPRRALGAVAVGATLAVIASGLAYAGSTDTSASLSTSASTPTSVTAGSSTDFNIYVTASGNVSGTGVATVTTQYSMATDGTITASTAAGDQQTLQFTPGFNYSQCPVSSPPQGCDSNPFVVSAHLAVAAGTPGGTTGTLTVGEAGSAGLSADDSPATGQVKVAGSSTPVDTAPSDPGVPTLDSASTTPNNTGDFTVDWTGSTDSDGDSVTYTLQAHNADVSIDWTTVDSGLTATSDALSGVAEGSWSYRVEAVDSHGTASAWATDSAPIVIVDLTDPYAPLVTSPTTADYTDGSNNWYADSVAVNFAEDDSTTSNGDPTLADGSAGSGVASVNGDTTVTSSDADPTTGAFSVDGTTTDNAGNTSSPTTVSGFLDWQKPVVSCPTTDQSVILHDPNASLTWTASDPAPSSGLTAGSSTGTVSLDTSEVGTQTVSIPAGAATDNVGHESDAVNCSYSVTYNWNGFLQPINDTAHFIGETTSIFKAGSTVPVKFQLTDALGNVVQSAAAPVWLTPQKGNALPSSLTVDETTYTTTSTAGGFYRWDSTGQQYIYNWNTAKSNAGYYWRIGVQLDDGSTHYVSIGLK